VAKKKGIMSLTPDLHLESVHHHHPVFQFKKHEGDSFEGAETKNAIKFSSHYIGSDISIKSLKRKT
jgi:hypothetical protein